MRAPKRGTDRRFGALKKIERFLKKFLTWQTAYGILNKLPPRKDGAGSTLKIEQCKNSLCKISTKKRVLEVRNDYKNSFESWKANQ